MNGGGRPWAKDGYEFLVANGSQLAPDRIVYQVYLENDFYDGIDYVLSRSQTSSAVPVEQPKIPRHSYIQSLKDMFRCRIRLLDFLWCHLVRFDFANDYLVRFNYRTGARNLLLRELPPLETKLVATELEFLDKIQQEAVRLHAPLTIVLVPFKLQLFHKELFSNARYDYKKPNQILRAFCASRQLTCVDLLETYERLDQETVKGYYYARDLHWTRAGHEQAATELATVLAKTME
jgi:hypothetical protein